MTTVTDAAYDDMAFARILVDAVEHGCTYEDRCVGVRAVLKRHREAAEARARLEGAEIMREAAAMACKDQAQDFLSPEYAVGQPVSSISERFACSECAEAIRNLDPAAILEAHTRAKAMDEQA